MKDILAAMHNFIMTWLDPLSIVVGLVVSVPIFWTWYEVIWGRRRKQSRWFNEVRKSPGRRPGILIVDLLDRRDIKTAIENYRQQQSFMKTIPDDRIFCVSRSKRLQPADIPTLIEDINKVSAQVISGGIDTLHYFHAGPAIAAAISGARFANSCRVILYQYSAGEYQSFGPLQLEE